LAYRCDAYEDFVLSVGRLDRAKRVDLLLEAAAAEPSVHVVIAGEGPDRERLEQVAQKHNLDGRADFRGRVDASELADLYARCGAVYYAPVDEDYGMVPYEAFLAEKPVVTTTDAGGPLDVVSDRRTGLVAAPRADALADALRYLRDHPDDGRAWGRAGKSVAERVTWDAAIERLLS
ncbi:MAG TPA: glycosyltransferase, partial [Gaiellaceae bacterium]|nr:glycosyltransferase [Gaiellaceae bacterium]